MPEITTAETQIAVHCAVFKIDLKGRFVYIDDEVEELLGASLEELFGRPLGEYISTKSRQLLEDILARHNRYDTFYDAITLGVKLRDGEFHSFNAVITLNFIAGNPVNYQVILLPQQSDDCAQPSNFERRFLALLGSEVEDIPIDEVAEIFCRVGGYNRADCYLPDDAGQLVSVGSYPKQEAGFAAPAYIELFSIEPRNRYSFRNEDRSLHDGFGDNRSEAVLFLNFKQHRLIVCLQGSAEYQPPQNCVNDIELYIRNWNERFPSYDTVSPYSEQFGMSGKIAAEQNVMMVLANDNFDILYYNDTFAECLHKSEIDNTTNDLTKIYESLPLTDFSGKPVAFDNSAFARTVMSGNRVSQTVRITGYDNSLQIVGCPIEINEETFFVYMISPLPEISGGKSAGNSLVLALTHDLRAPIITIEAFAKRLSKQHREELSEDGTFAVDCIAENTNIVSALLAGIEQMAQMRGNDEDFTTFPLADVLKDISRQMKAQYPKSAHKVSLPSKLPEITAPKMKFTAVLRNIIDNAYKYSAATKKPEIVFSYAWQGDGYAFTVSDNGPGIPAKYRAKVFEPFFCNPDMLENAGIGVGLSIAKDIVTSWGGTIVIDDKKTIGTSMTFILPVEGGE